MMAKITKIKPKNKLLLNNPFFLEAEVELSVPSSEVRRSAGIACPMAGPNISFDGRIGPDSGREVRSFAAITLSDWTVFIKWAECFA